MTTASIVPVLGQGNRPPEPQACYDQRVDQPADLHNRMAACLRVIGDSSVSADKRAEAYLRRGFAYAQSAGQSNSKEDFDRALADLSDGSRLAPNNQGVQKYVHETRAGLYVRKGDHDRAIAEYTALLRLEPNSATAYAYRGIIYRTIGKTSESIADLRKALSLDPSNAVVKEALAPAETAQPTVSEADNKGADIKQIELLKAEVRKAQEAAKAVEERLAALETAKVAAPAPQPTEPAPAGPDRAKLARDLQSELERVGCHPGAIDAQWGKKTQQALQKFAEHTTLALPLGEPTTAALDAVSAQKGRVCPLACANGEAEVAGSCVARQSKAKGQRRHVSSRPRRSQEGSAERPSGDPPIGITIGVGRRRGGIGIGF